MGRTQDKVAIVTGGSVGLGKAQANMLAREGAKVVITDIKEQDGLKVADEINSDGGTAIFMKHDVASEDEWKATIGRTLDKYNRLDVLVNNAGVAFSDNVEETSLEDWKKLMTVNLDGVFLGTKYAVKEMKKSKGGSIINMSSIEGLVGDPNFPAYNASKGGVRLLTKSAALHCANSGYNIRVNSVHPGYIWTPMVENYLKSQGDIEEGKKKLADMHPIGHIGEPDDIAYAVVYLASDEAKFMTGAEIVIDGGYTAQ
jgi:3(or 17)beta-hydroxysteroid dehydrogenase